MGLGLPKCGSCLPDAISFAKDSDRQEESLSSSVGRDAYDAAGQMVDEHTTVTPVTDCDVIFQDDRALNTAYVQAKPSVPAKAAPVAVAAHVTSHHFEYGADSASMLNDLDFLASPEWQTMPPATTTALDEKLLTEAREAAIGSAAYPVALRALWHNCPDALEVALQRLDAASLGEAQARDAELMSQKLEFTRIRQEFVALCYEFRGPEGSLMGLQKGVASAEERCEKLMARQPDEQFSQLPGLVQKRDTIMLLARIRTIYARLQEFKPQVSE
mmetsp:Transcript_4117/g.7453  ORF Transcript_4117/g.7453 Transcript_4117/m.7453 type:complete len:273 (-) Transcript_4117:31-849(-)